MAARGKKREVLFAIESEDQWNEQVNFDNKKLICKCFGE